MKNIARKCFSNSFISDRPTNRLKLRPIELLLQLYETVYFLKMFRVNFFLLFVNEGWCLLPIVNNPVVIFELYQEIQISFEFQRFLCPGIPRTMLPYDEELVLWIS